MAAGGPNRKVAILTVDFPCGVHRPTETTPQVSVPLAPEADLSLRNSGSDLLQKTPSGGSTSRISYSLSSSSIASVAPQITEASLLFLRCGDLPTMPILVIKKDKDARNEIYLFGCPNIGFFGLAEYGLRWQDVKMIFLSNIDRDFRAIESYVYKTFFFPFGTKVKVAIKKENQKPLWYGKLAAGLGGLKGIEVGIDTLFDWHFEPKIQLDNEIAIERFDINDADDAFYIVTINGKRTIICPGCSLLKIDQQLLREAQLVSCEHGSEIVAADFPNTCFYNIDSSIGLPFKAKVADRKKIDLLDFKSPVDISECRPAVLKKIDPTNCSVTAVGCNDAFGSQNTTWLFIGESGEYHILDYGLTTEGNLKELGIALRKILKMLLSHTHADHIGGVERHCQIVKGVTIYVNAELAEIIKYKYFNGDWSGINIVSIEDEYPKFPKVSFVSDGLKFTYFRVEHMHDYKKLLPTYAVMVEMPNGNKFLFTTDLTIETFKNSYFLYFQVALEEVDMVFCDISFKEPSPVHPYYKALIDLYKGTLLARKFVFTHYNPDDLTDAIKKELIAAGFEKGFIKQGDNFDQNLVRKNLLEVREISPEMCVARVP